MKQALTLLLAALPVLAPAQSVIVDNGTTGFSVRKGSWPASATTGFYGSGSLINFVDRLDDRVRWTPNLPAAGRYTVSAWWVASSNRAAAAPYLITHRSGTTTVAADQTKNGSQWVALGTFAFNGGTTGYVELSDTAPAGEYVSADAVKFDFAGPLVESPCAIAPPSFTTLSGGSCGGCRGLLLPGALEDHPASRWYIHSDLPEQFRAPGVLYGTVPELPASLANPLPQAVRAQTNSSFPGIDDDFDLFMFHISSPGDGSAPRRMVVYVRNDGASAVRLDPRQILITDGVIGDVHEMESNLGRRVLAEEWDARVSALTLQPGAGGVVAYSKGFSGFPNGADMSANVNCFGNVRVGVEPATAGDASPVNLTAWVVGIPYNSNISRIRTTTEGLLSTGAESAETVVNMTRPPQGCELSRATGVFRTFVWRSAVPTFDLDAMPSQGYGFQMGLSKTQALGCDAAAQTRNLILKPGYAPNDTVGNYMVEYRVAVTLRNTNPTQARAFDVTFTKSDADIGLAWQVARGPALPPDGEVDARPVRTGWAGPRQSPSVRSLLGQDGGPVTLAPCSQQTVAFRFLVLGNSSLPFQLTVAPAPAGAVPSPDLWRVE